MRASTNMCLGKSTDLLETRLTRACARQSQKHASHMTHLRRPGEMSAPHSFLIIRVNQAPKLVGVKPVPVIGDRKSRALLESLGSCKHRECMLECRLPSHMRCVRKGEAFRRKSHHTQTRLAPQELQQGRVSISTPRFKVLREHVVLAGCRQMEGADGSRPQLAAVFVMPPETRRSL